MNDNFPILPVSLLDNGQPAYSVVLDTEGKIHGDFKTFRSDGSVEVHAKYLHGKVIEAKLFNLHGVVISEDFAFNLHGAVEEKP
jgi:glycine cleavage system aminomethyltransferase T